jgi:hypothetical protein
MLPEAIYTAFDLDPDVGGDKALLVPCVLQLKPKQVGHFLSFPKEI